jgi:hypothetical protein
MCVFTNIPVHKIHILSREDALIGYKFLNIAEENPGSLGRETVLMSPIYKGRYGLKARWSSGRLTADKLPQKGKEGGIYVYSNITRTWDQTPSNAIVAEVAVWGKVIEHRKSTAWNSTYKDGFRAQHAEIIAVIARDDRIYHSVERLVERTKWLDIDVPIRRKKR